MRIPWQGTNDSQIKPDANRLWSPRLHNKVVILSRSRIESFDFAFFASHLTRSFLGQKQWLIIIQDDGSGEKIQWTELPYFLSK